jgi:hypothetical protein
VTTVNARTDPPDALGRRERSPGVGSVALRTATVSMDTLSADTIDHGISRQREREQAQRDVGVCNAELARSARHRSRRSPARSGRASSTSTSRRCPRPSGRSFSLPTTFALPQETVKRFIAVGGTLLDGSENFQKLLRALRGKPSLGAGIGESCTACERARRHARDRRRACRAGATPELRAVRSASDSPGTPRQAREGRQQQRPFAERQVAEHVREARPARPPSRSRRRCHRATSRARRRPTPGARPRDTRRPPPRRHAPDAGHRPRARGRRAALERAGAGDRVPAAAASRGGRRALRQEVADRDASRRCRQRRDGLLRTERLHRPI